jgi:Zn-dependent protease with chaperone function
MRLMRPLLWLFVVWLLLPPVWTRAQPAQGSSPPAAAASGEQKKETPREYTLPPDKLQKAIAYSRAQYWMHFGGALYGILVLVAILAWGASAKFRDWAEAASPRRFFQVLVFVPLLTLATDVPNLPLGMYSQHLALFYDQSVQGWGSWFWDWTKGELIGLVITTILVFILYGVIRRSPRRWWFYFWLASLPILFTIIFLTPLVIEPLFFQFEPLTKEHAPLVNELEKVVIRGGLAIPPDRMFEMKASEKLKSLNAYVTGLGASKRVVVWDTTIAKLTTPETLFVFGHEMGHYVLGHIRNSLILASLFALILLFIGYHALHWLLHRWGDRWSVREVSDWASLPALLLIVSVLGFVSEPITNGYSRWQEHQADIYGLEVIHGIVPDSKEVATHAFQVLGEVGLDEPNPNPFIEFWLYNHPSTSKRVAFVQGYDPWTNGTPKYVKVELQ